MLRSYSLLTAVVVLIVSSSALAQNAPTLAPNPPEAEQADAVTTSDQVIVSETIPAPNIEPQTQAEVLPDHVAQPQVESQPALTSIQQPCAVCPTRPASLGELIRANGDARRRLHDAQNVQERELREQHRAQRYAMEDQIRMLPVGSYQRKEMARQLSELRRSQERAEDYLDDYNDYQRRILYDKHRLQEATYRSRLSVQTASTARVHVGVTPTVVAPRPVVVPSTSVRVHTRRGLFRRGGVNVHTPRASVRVGW